MTLSSDMPTVKVELALGYGPLETTLSWTDVSNYLMGFTIDRGRQYELDVFEAGTATITLLNNSGDFDVLHQGALYAGAPHCPVRITATWAGVAYVLFRGFVERWPVVRYGGKYTSKVTLTCVDAFALFANMRFPLREDGVGGGTKVIGKYTFTTNTYTNSDNFASPNEGVRLYVLGNITELATGAAAVFNQLQLNITYTNGNGNGNRSGTITCNHRFPATHPSHVGRHGHHGKRAKGGHGHGWHRLLDVTLQDNDTIRSIQDVVKKSGTFTGKEAVLTFTGEKAIIPRGTSDDQLTKALAYHGWPNGTRLNVKHTGQFTLVPEQPFGKSLLDVVREIQDSEMGQIYVDGSGVVQFEDRDWRSRAANWVPSSWGDGGGTDQLVYSEVEPSYDNERIATYWEVTRVSLGPNDTPWTQTAVASTALVTKYGMIGGQRTTAVVANSVAQKQAQYLLGFTQSPQYRIPKLRILPRLNPAMQWPTVLGMEISSALTVRQYPPTGGGGRYGTATDQWVEHVHHEFTLDNWVTELQLSPRLNVSFPP